MLLVIFSFSMLYSCGGGNGNTGGNWTEIDSAEDTAAVEQNHQMSSSKDPSDFDPNNWVKVDLDENSNFNWEEFKNQFQARAEAIGAGFQLDDDEITSSWEELNDDYSYQTVYRYRDNGLWLQTYYRKNNGQSEAEPLEDEDRTLLTREEAQNSDLNEIWEKMEEAARSFKDSIF